MLARRYRAARRHFFVVLLSLSSLLTTAGCAADPPSQAGAAAPGGPAVRVVYQSSQCRAGADQGLLSWIEDQPAWDRRYRAITGGGGRAGRPAPGVDFSRQRLLLISMGLRPSAGYQVSPGGSAHLDGDSLRIPVRWREPAPGMMQAAVMTSPCLLLALPVQGYGRVVLVDEQGKERGSIAIPGDTGQ